jgi:hypothetical protein
MDRPQHGAACGDERLVRAQRMAVMDIGAFLPEDRRRKRAAKDHGEHAPADERYARQATSEPNLLEQVYHDATTGNAQAP